MLNLAELEIVPVDMHGEETECRPKNSGVRLELDGIRIELQTDFDVKTLEDVLLLQEDRRCCR